MTQLFCHVFFFFFNDTATTEIYTLSLHDALPICEVSCTLMNARTSVELGTWERLTEIESFVNEIAEPRGMTLGTEIEIDSITRGWKVSDGARVVAAADLGMDDLAGIAAA